MSPGRRGRLVAEAPAAVEARRERRRRSRKRLPAAGRPVRMWSAILRNGLGVMRASIESGLSRNQLLAVCKGRRGCRRDLPAKVYAALARLGCELERFGVRSPGDLLLPLSDREAAACRARSDRLRRASGRDTVLLPAVVHVTVDDYWPGDRPDGLGATADKNRRDTEMLTSTTWRALGMTSNPWRPPRGKDDLFLTRDMRACADLVEQACREQDFLALVGEVGCGKTTVLRYALEPLALSAQYAISHVMALARERVNARVILEAMARDFEGAETHIARSIESLTRQVCDHVQGLLRRNVAPVLVIDEAQALHASALAPLKRIRELTAVGYEAGCAVILVGQTGAQPDLKMKLSLPTVQEVARRVTVVELGGLGEAIPEYLAWRWKRAGAGNRKVVDDAAVAALMAHFGGAADARGRGADRRWSVGPQELEQVLSPAMTLAARAGEGRVTVATLSKVLRNFREPEASGDEKGGAG